MLGDPVLDTLDGSTPAFRTAAGVIAQLPLLTNGCPPVAVYDVIHNLSGVSFAACGLVAWRRRPENRTGALMVLLGFAWFVFTLDAADAPLVHTFALVAGGLWGGVFLHLGLSFPSGRLGTPIDRRLAIAGPASSLRIFVRPIGRWAAGAARDRLAAVDDALNAYGSGRADGMAARRDRERASDPEHHLLHAVRSRSAAWSAAAAGPRSNGVPSTDTTGITSRTEDEVKTSSAARPFSSSMTPELVRMSAPLPPVESMLT